MVLHYHFFETEFYERLNMATCPHCNKLLDIETMQSLHTICVNQEAFKRELDKHGLDLTVKSNGEFILVSRKGKPIYDIAFGESKIDHKGPSNFDPVKLAVEVRLKQTDVLTSEAVAKVRGPREKEYGNKLINFTDIAELENAAHGFHAVPEANPPFKRTAETVAIDNICQKLARLRKSPDHYDTLVDIIGYVLCYRDIRRARNPEHYEKEEARFSAEKA